MHHNTVAESRTWKYVLQQIRETKQRPPTAGTAQRHLKKGVEEWGLKGVVKCVEHQDGGCRCGYYSLWYLWQAIHAGDTVHMAGLQFPDVESESVDTRPANGA